MDNQSYYRIQDEDGCNLASREFPLQVNCTGVSVLNRPFVTWRPYGRQDYYLMFVSRGELLLQIRDQEVSFKAGQFVILRPGYATRYSKADQRDMNYYWVHFTGSRVEQLLAECALLDETVYFAGVSENIINDFQRLFDSFLYRDICLQPATASILMLLLVRLSRNASNQKKKAEAGPERLSRSLAYIHKHYSQALTVQKLAELEHLSTSRYSALFRSCMGQSPQSFIIDMRLRIAIELLSQTDLTVKQVAHTVGYTDQLYFSRLFRARKGVPPSHFQQASGTVASQQDEL